MAQGISLWSSITIPYCYMTAYPANISAFLNWFFLCFIPTKIGPNLIKYKYENIRNMPK